MITNTASHLLATNGQENLMRTFAWSGLPILDVCSVQADFGHLLVVTTDGVLYGINLDAGVSVNLCSVSLPDCPIGEHVDNFGAPAYRLHATSDGKYVAIVVDRGRKGLIVETRTGTVTMELDGGDYFENTVPFSACFLRFEGRDVIVHRTAWNRLDASDPVTGASFTARELAPCEHDGERPEHYLDYFHGHLLPSPSGCRLFDDGWVWHPVSVPRTWSVTDWLGSNPWESEDGASIVDLTMRDDWDTPACWITDQHIAVWGLAELEDEEATEVGKGQGVRIFDATTSTQSLDGKWQMDSNESRVRDLFSDGQRLYVADESGTTVWDIDSRSQVLRLPNFTARLLDAKRGMLIAVGPSAIVELALQWRATKVG